MEGHLLGSDGAIWDRCTGRDLSPARDDPSQKVRRPTRSEQNEKGDCSDARRESLETAEVDVHLSEPVRLLAPSFPPSLLVSFSREHYLLSRYHKLVAWRAIYLTTVPYHYSILAGIASSSLVWNMYSLLTPIRYVLNPRFHLTSPLQSGLFYLAPGAGYLLGTFFGGRYADYVVKKYIRLSPTHSRHPEDRLRSALPFMGIAIPACVLIYGWSVERNVGGIPLVVIVLFLQGVAQLFCFPSLNTYCLDVMQGNGSDVIAGNYFIRYLFACMGTAVVLPAVEHIGVGWFSTISALFLLVSAGGVWAVVIWGRGWREAVDAKRRAKRRGKAEGKERRGDVEAARGGVS